MPRTTPILKFASIALVIAMAASPALAVNLFTVNETSATGVAGSEKLVPTFVSMADPTGIGGTFTQGGIYVPYMGTMTTCTSLIGTGSGDCSGWGSASIVAWANGLYYDPRFGTPFVPPSGDHHRTGYRMMMQPSFSGGQWLSGFAPFENVIPFTSVVGSSGAGGDIGLALADASAEAGLVGILGLLDAHGAPVTTGRFPWSVERDAMADTLMVKYTAGGGTTDLDLFSQSLRSSVGFARNATLLRWRTMSNVDGAFSATPAGNSYGCGGPWCEFYVTEDTAGNVHLWVVKNADGNTDTADGTPVEITQATRMDTLSAIANGGIATWSRPLSNIEKLPFVIDDRLSQYSTEAGVPGDFEQQLLSQFRVVSGPNVHMEENADPYSWVICGTRGTIYGEADCTQESDVNQSGAIDAGGHVFAIVYVPNNNTVELGESPLTRFGLDMSPRRLGNTLYPQGYVDTLDPDTTQDPAAYVECTAGPATQSVHPTSSCESDPGLDGAYGTADDGTIYYREAIENGLRGWIRESNGHAFSFLGADTDGAHDGVSPANFGLTQLVEQIEPTQGVLISCLGCSPHTLPL
ncbi:MAG TPA: hypothetical protein VFN94_08355, partial [Nitrospiria bacterium]|nr:hypothetical protein [Nitrospiria bacterium]